MEEQTRKLLEECSSGCIMAVNSMDQISKYISDEKLGKVVEKYRTKHKETEKKVAGLLQNAGKEEKEPNVAATAFSSFTTGAKMMINNDNSKIATVMMDGCNMGIKSMCGYINQYTRASGESISLAKDIVNIEEDFVRNLEYFL